MTTSGEGDEEDGQKGVPEFGRILGELRQHMGLTQAELSQKLPWKLGGKQIVNFFENKGRGSFEKAWDVLHYLYDGGYNLNYFFNPENEPMRRPDQDEVAVHQATIAGRHAVLAEELEKLEAELSHAATVRLAAFRERALEIYQPVSFSEEESIGMGTKQTPRPAEAPGQKPAVG